MGSIVTVTGEVPSADIGAVLMHEHILCDLYRISGIPDHQLNDVDLAVSELGHLDETPVRTVVDVTSVGLGRRCVHSFPSPRLRRRWLPVLCHGLLRLSAKGRLR